MEKRKKSDRILIVTICVIAGICVVAGPGRVLVEKCKETINETARKAQVKKNRAKLRDDEYVQAQIMDYLEERYHEKFVKKSYNEYLASWYGNYVSMKVWPEGKEDEEHLIYVEGHLNDEGNLDYYDSYVYARLKKEFVKYYEPVMDEYFEEYESEVSFLTVDMTYNLSADITVEEVLEAPHYKKPFLKIYMNPEQKFDLKKIKSFCKTMQIKKFRGEITVFVPGNEETFRELPKAARYDGEWHRFYMYGDDEITGRDNKGDEVVWD